MNQIEQLLLGDSNIVGNIIDRPLDLVVALCLAFLLGILIAFTYRQTHRGFSYSQGFSMTLVIMTVITAFIIILIADNIARAIGIFGAFSVIRFRTAVKDTRDTAFIFFALAAGLSMGTGHIVFGFIGTAIITAVIFLLHKFNFGGTSKTDFVLHFRLGTDLYTSDMFSSLFRKHLRNHTLLNIVTKNQGQTLEFSFNITLKEIDKMDNFLHELKKIKGVDDVNFVSSKNDLEF